MDRNSRSPSSRSIFKRNIAASISVRFPQFHVGVSLGHGGLCGHMAFRSLHRLRVEMFGEAYFVHCLFCLRMPREFITSANEHSTPVARLSKSGSGNDPVLHSFLQGTRHPIPGVSMGSKFSPAESFYPAIEIRDATLIALSATRIVGGRECRRTLPPRSDPALKVPAHAPHGWQTRTLKPHGRLSLHLVWYPTGKCLTQKEVAG